MIYKNGALPNDKILDWSKLKALADDEINLYKKKKKSKLVFGRVENIVGKGEKCCLPAFSPFPTMFSPFPTMFSKGFFLEVVKSRDCVVKS